MVKNASNKRQSAYLFVYGTLKKNAKGSFAKYFKKKAKFIKKTHWNGRLYLIDYYPGAVPTNNNFYKIKGELWKVKRSLLVKIDEYEECNDNILVYNEYKRIIQKFQTGKKIYYAWIYIYLKNTSNFKEIKNGNFKNNLL